MTDYTDDEDYQQLANDLIEPFSDVHDDDVALEAILLRIAELYGPLDHLIFDDDDGEQEAISLTFNYRTRTFSRAAVRGVAPDRDHHSTDCFLGEHATCDGCACDCHLRQHLVRLFENSDLTASRLADEVIALLASGVLGVPADPGEIDMSSAQVDGYGNYYCPACKSWLPLDGNWGAVALQEHVGEIHD